MWNRFGSVSRVLELHDHFFKPFELYRPGSYDGFLRGLANQPCQQYDQFFTESVVGRLFQAGRMPFGMDLVALNLQRGRDHGIPSYNEYRAECGLRKAKDFDDLADFISFEAIANLKTLYESVDDIDLFIGGIVERPLFEGGGTVGPTFTCILGDQFARLKRGDRFYYEEGNQAGSFTPEQLSSIRSVSLARIICDNGDDIQALQPLVFFQPSNM
ncbi:unnamed protein product [Notodromas monacha]|uniref:Peroxidase n=1 Tax=Notodromas monacha TaxID=399045 RepID=A0A7R9GJ76_9CRUS|nr:unnamed protein product [Notodromas monacha]CAG0923241.1 unnamed protein product [Notodromas monacha]